MITPFWRKEPLNDKETELLEALFEGHRAATRRQNISSEVLKAAYIGSGDFNQAVAAALCTLGGTHAPIIQSYELLSGDTNIDYYLYREEKIPGWGSSFCKGKMDDILARWYDLLSYWPEMRAKIDETTIQLHELGWNIFPNMASASAATGIVLKMSKEITPMLFLAGRIEPWAEICYAIQKSDQKTKV